MVLSKDCDIIILVLGKEHGGRESDDSGPVRLCSVNHSLPQPESRNARLSSPSSYIPKDHYILLRRHNCVCTKCGKWVSDQKMVVSLVRVSLVTSGSADEEASRSSTTAETRRELDNTRVQQQSREHRNRLYDE